MQNEQTGSTNDGILQMQGCEAKSYDYNKILVDDFLCVLFLKTKNYRDIRKSSSMDAILNVVPRHTVSSKPSSIIFRGA